MRQSPIQQLLVERGVEFVDSDGALRPTDSIRDLSGEDLYLRDRSVLRKWTLCGTGAGGWLNSKGHSLRAVGDIVRLEDGDLIAKVGLSTYFLESNRRGGAAEILRKELSASPFEGAYAFPDERASFELGGTRVGDVIRQTCSFDTRQSQGKLIMTIIAGVSCYLLCSGSKENSQYLIWTDASNAHYLWCEIVTICESHSSGQSTNWG